MSNIVLRTENLSKSYIIGHEKREHYVALRDVVTNKAKQFANKTKHIIKGGQLIAGNEFEEFWALKDVNFELKKGDRFGIIGRNGAGKSTLLKVLSRITEPTKGRIQINGHVASLLEVGTGFHPELSGKENIFLNGAILGMSRKDIIKRFDEIVEFAGVNKFLDTPVKRYSSGMYVRLAFAVAAHLETEILVVDEVLAVGDAEFQKKCLGKMSEVSQEEGKTVLFVSHNMAAVKELCDTAILLNNGKISNIGPTNNIVREYLSKPIKLNQHQNILTDYKNRRGFGEVRFTDILINDDNIPIDPTSEIKIVFTAKVNNTVDSIYFYLSIRDPLNGNSITETKHECLFFDTVYVGTDFSFEFTIPTNTLRTGIFPTYFWLGKNIELCDYPFDIIDNVFSLNLDSDKRTDELGYNSEQPNGLFNLNYKIFNLKKTTA